jgi:hypothetical protein
MVKAALLYKDHLTAGAAKQTAAKTAEPWLFDYLLDDHGSILSVTTATDIADYGRNIVTIQHTDNNCYRFPLHSYSDSDHAYIYIAHYVSFHGSINTVLRFNLSYANYYRSLDDLRRDVLSDSDNSHIEYTYYARKKFLELDAGDYKSYNENTLDKFINDLNIVAAELGIPFEDAKVLLERAVHKENSRVDSGSRASKVKFKLTAVRLRAAYTTLLQEIDNPSSALTETERLSQARALIQTYDRLRQHDPTFNESPEQVRSARSLVNSLNYQRRKSITEDFQP